MRGGGISLLGLLCLLASAPAAAGSVYRCDGPNGRSYVSDPIAGATCSVVHSYASGNYSPPEPASVPQVARPGAPAGVGDASPSPDTDAGDPSPEVLSRTVAVATDKPTHRVSGRVYSYIKDGVRHYTSNRPSGGSGISSVRTIKYSFIETCFACSASSGVTFATVPLNLDAYQAEIRAAAAEYGVDPAIVRAVIHAESSFDVNALSRAGAQGLMQLMPATARRFGVSNAFNAAQNIRGGVEYLAWLLERFDGNLTLAAAGYNAGEGAVDKYDGVPPYRETQRYVKRVGILAERYRSAQ